MKKLLQITLVTLGIIIAFWSCEQRDPTKQPTACFTVSADHIFVGESVSFTNCSEDGQSYVWEFGDNNNSLLENPVHKFNEEGEFVVVLQVSNRELQDNTQKTIYVAELEPGELAVITNSVTNITENSATCSGNVVSDLEITAKGVCWSKSTNPTIAATHSSEGTTVGEFSSEITGLDASTTYFVRAYATNKDLGTVYGTEKSFTTNALPGTPSVSTVQITEITSSSAKCGGNVTDDGGVAVTQKGVCWSTQQNPTNNDLHTSNGSGMGQFTSELTNLDPNTTYYVRAYAVNDAVFYGEQKEFTTEEDVPAELIQIEPADFDENQEITLYYNAKMGDGALVGYTGDVYAYTGLNTSVGPWRYKIEEDWNANNDKVKLERVSTDYYKLVITPSILGFYNCPSDETVFQMNFVFRSSDGSISGRNEDGTDIFVDVNEIVVMPPGLVTYPIINIGETTAISGGTIYFDGYAWVSSFGVCYGTNSNPTIENNEFTVDGNGWNSFESSLTGLAPGTTYYLRAYAVNEAGVGYGNEISFTTIPSNAKILLSEDFQVYENYDVIDRSEWIQYIETGTSKWVAREYHANKYAQFGSYGTGEENLVSLVSAPIDLSNSVNNTLTFDLNVGYWTHEGLQIFIVENLTGEDFANATWTDITNNFDIPSEPTNSYGQFIHSNPYSLSAYSGTVYLAFKYSGNENTGLTCTYQIDNVLVIGE